MMTLLFIALAAQVSPSSELSDVRDTQRLALAALIQCVDEKAKALDDRQESVKTIVEASFTACKDVRTKAIFLTSWKRRLESKKGNEEAMDYALEFQKAFDKKLMDDAVLKLLEDRSASTDKP